MHILVTGAAGFIGQIVTKQLLEDPSHTVLLADVIDPPIPAGTKHPHNAKSLRVDLCAATNDAVNENLDAVFIFHGIMSSGSEANFDLGMRVNIDATRSLLEALRHTCPGVRVIYASSLAVYGQPLPEIVTEAVVPTPQSSYGAEKLVCETLVNEYTRRGFIDGLGLRFPTVSVRPGKPTAAASSFLSGMIREPMNGVECVVPIEDRGFKSWLCSPKTLVKNLMHALVMSTGKLPKHIRQINLPGICVSVQQMRDALEKVGGRDKLEFLKEKEDPEVATILRCWGARFDDRKAIELGFNRDQSFEQAVVDYREGLKFPHS